MSTTRRPACERTRVLAALAPDRELSEFEQRLLLRHLDRCDDCRTFARSVAVIAHELRATPRESMSTEPMPLPKRPRRTLKLPLVALMATAAVMLMTSVALREVPEPVPATGQSVDSATAPDDQVVLRQLREIVHTRQLVPDYRPDTPGIT